MPDQIDYRLLQVNQHRRTRGGGWPTDRHLTSGQQTAGLPSSGQARCVVGAKDAFGQQLERALWTPTGPPGPLEATTLMTTGDHHFGGVIIEDRGCQDGQRAAGGGGLDGRITARGWLRRLRSRTLPPRARRVDRSTGPHGQEPGGLPR